MESINIKKLAEALQLNISTVSRALKNHPQISASTKARVREAALQLNYIPNANAVNLRANNSRIFGVLIPSITNSFYASFINVLDLLSRQQNYSLQIIQSLDDPKREEEILHTFILNRVQGVFACITPNTTSFALFDKFNELKIPVLYFDKVPEKVNNVKVTMNDSIAAALAAKAIIRSGKTKVLALLGNPNLSITQKREHSLKRELNKYKQIQVNVSYCDNLIAAKENTLQLCCKADRPMLIFCMSDEILLGTMRAIMELGLKYPEQISIIAMSEGEIPTLYYPEITFIETNGKKLGHACFQAMQKLMKQEAVEENILIPTVLVEKGSV